MPTNGKLSNLTALLKRLRSVVVAYSGGLDSTFLLKAALDTLGRRNVLAVTACSETYPRSEYRQAREVARKIGARLIAINTSELKIRGFSGNPVNRCYYCKKELFSKLRAIAKRHQMAVVVDGTNFDDLKDVRHGRKAAKELGVRSPLLEARFTKGDIRRASKALGLPTWDKPSFACLASRVPFYRRIDRETLERIERAEAYLRSLGIRQVRVRAHGDIARIEVAPADFVKMLKRKGAITARLKKIGFVYTALDLAGYRTGSMHEPLLTK